MSTENIVARWKDRGYNWLGNHLIYPLFDLVQGSCVLKCLRELEESQWLSPEELSSRQWKGVRALLGHAYAAVPYYRRRFQEIGLHPEDIRKPEDMLSIPVLTKQDIQSHTEELISRETDLKELLPFATGGTTGEPTRFYFDRLAASYVKAASLRSWKWTGVRKSDRKVTLMGSGFDVASSRRLKSQAWHYLSRNKHLPIFAVNEESLAKYYEIIRSYRPQLIRGYASGILLFSRYLQEQGPLDLKVKAVLTSSDTIYPHERKQIEAVFQCPTFDSYSSREFVLANQCERREGYHICAENLYLEFLKEGRHARPGELGRIIVTDLRNYAFPFIRYEIGDMGTPTDKYCSCGRGLPLMESVRGRDYGFVSTKEGSLIHHLFFPQLFKEIDSVIKEYQVIQKDRGKLLIKIVKAKDFDRRHVDFILRHLRRVLGEEIAVEFEYCDKIARWPSGKRQTVISKVPLPL